ncbi:DUF2842 domain-containing protein [Tropicimonas sp. IMCC6043]|uniref:DUF2842 domain-containing protein n=1 Tax=Tropicimonas sp. IMCC6043 TaxID=2510645 RepID=UPI00101DA8DB|nr:DUF2842 domain-containing protein [Tropicimonas sp. IMCC6043]RYH09574.1 DUF2842 domain-containing protein [Tropicimonas sp. IMCC6043]
MALSYKARRRWSLVILLVGMPVYVVVAVTLLNLLGRPPVLVELAVYVILGILWALPFRFLFRGIGQADPDGEAGTDAATRQADRRDRDDAPPPGGV